MINKQKIKDFVYDESMSNSVYEILMAFFLKKRETKDVQLLAAERLSALMLEDAWRELSKYKIEEKEEKEYSNPGL